MISRLVSILSLMYAHENNIYGWSHVSQTMNEIMKEVISTSLRSSFSELKFLKLSHLTRDLSQAENKITVVKS